MEHYKDSQIIFTKDNPIDPEDKYSDEVFFKALGGADAYPITIILDENGVIIATLLRATTYDELSRIVEEQLAKLQSSISEFDEDEQEALLEYTSSVFEVNEDKHGRIRIPDILVEFAGLKKDIVTVGMGNKLSIMTKELREEKRSKRTHAQNMDILNKKLKG